MLHNYTQSDIAAIKARLSKGESLSGLVLSRPKRRNNEESLAQQALISWWAIACKGYHLPEIALIAIPLQGHRSIVNAVRMKREGLRAGTWDLQLLVPRNGFHSLWIEMKAAKGRLSPEQIVFGEYLESMNYHVEVCYNLDQAVRAIVSYLSL